MKKEKSFFKCWKTGLYGTCKNCLRVHNEICDYHTVMDFTPIKERNRCPICSNKKNMEKCKACCEKKEATKPKRKLSKPTD